MRYPHPLHVSTAIAAFGQRHSGYTTIASGEPQESPFLYASLLVYFAGLVPGMSA